MIVNAVSPEHWLYNKTSSCTIYTCDLKISYFIHRHFAKIAYTILLETGR